MSKIVRLLSENVKRVRVIEITPDGAAVVIRGNNEQGKSSLLDSIEYALAGKRTHPKKVIREGASKARVVVETDDLIVERTWENEKGSTLVVKSKEGKVFTSPQKMLDDLLGSLSFDPLSFMGQGPAVQVETLSDLVGLDFSDIEKKGALFFDQRKDLNREVKRLELNMPTVEPEFPENLIDVAALVDELEKMAEDQHAIDRHEEREARNVADLSRVANRIKALEKELKAVKKEGGELTEERDKILKNAKSLPGAPNTAPIREKIDTAEENNELHRTGEAWRLDKEALAKTMGEAEVLTQKLADLKAERKQQIESAEFPVRGLSLTEDGLTYDGLPFEQAAQSVQLRVSVAIGFALNPKLRVVLIREGSFLDKKNLALVAQMAEEMDAQVWIEMVGDEGVGVVIEDGRVKEEAKAS